MTTERPSMRSLEPDSDDWPRVSDLAAIDPRSRLARLEQMERDDPPHVDMERLQRVWEQIEMSALADAIYLPREQVEHRTSIDGWYQGNWRATLIDSHTNRCNTAMCLAGWTTHLDALERGDASGGWLISHEELIAARLRQHETGRTAYRNPAITERATYVASVLAEERADGLVPREDDPVDHVRVIQVEVPRNLRDQDPHPLEQHDGHASHGWSRVPGVGVEHRATRLLGLTPREAEQLFSGDNTLAVLRERVHATIAAERMRRVRRAEIERLREIIELAERRLMDDLGRPADEAEQPEG